MIQAIGWMLIGFGLGYMLCGREPSHATSARPLSHAERPLRPAFLLYPAFSCGVQRNSTRAVAGFLRGGLPLRRLGLSMPNSSTYKYYLQSSLDDGLLSVHLIKEARMETKTPVLLSQIGYMLDHPGTLGEVAAYMKRLEEKNQKLVTALRDTVTRYDFGDLTANEHEDAGSARAAITCARVILRELGEDQIA